MSDINDDSRRTRRRAVRTAGPPEEDATDVGASDGGAAGAEAATVKASAAESTASSGSADSTPATRTTPGKPAAKRSAAGQPTSAEAEAKAKTSAVKKSPDAQETSDEAAEPATVVLSKSVDETVAGEESAEPATVVLSKSADADETVDGDESAGSARFAMRRIVLVAAAAVLIAALVAGAVVSVFTVRSIDRQADRRTAYVQTAEQAILNLTTINADTAAEDIDRILSLASGKFKTEFDGRVDPFLTIVQQAEVRATGEIIEAALESDEENSAKVLVAAKQSLTNAGQEGPQTRYYRFRVTVSESDSGLTASNVEFVP
ncbi:hypothetical protein [Nocardia shimofusensis]|uniref:hypothetical protein n=1 Tax=Nocardia shimofusensis TaxID=228596 RepID=UPI0008373823|nr:hypothetical protein [Nocardia shimofusensis]